MMKTRGELEHQVILLKQQGMSKRAIARSLQISRHTVNKILLKNEYNRTTKHTAIPERTRFSRRSKLDPYRESVKQLIERFPDITAQRVFEELKAYGFDGGLSIVKTLVKKLKPKPMPKISLPTADYGPGEMAESDWSSYTLNFTHAQKRELHFFAYVLLYSRRKSFSFHESENLHTLMDGHVQSFERFGGVAQGCKYDNQKAVVLRWEGRQPIYNPRFVDFCAYYRYSPVACRPYHPNDKPTVERSFWELERSFFNGRQFRDEQDLSLQLNKWMDEICDKRRHRRLKCTPLERFAEEQPYLNALPKFAYDTARVVYRLCDVEGCISWDGNRYEVPYEYVTDILPIRITSKQLFVYAPDLSCVAIHELRRKGTGDRAELPNGRKRPNRHGPNLDQLRIVYEELGPEAAEYLKGLINTESRSAAYHARKILAMRGRYDTADLLRALAHGLHYQSFDYHVVERILQVQARPRRLDEYVSDATKQKLAAFLGQCHTEPRSLRGYDDLPCFELEQEQGDRKPCQENENPMMEIPPETTSEDT